MQKNKAMKQESLFFFWFALKDFIEINYVNRCLLNNWKSFYCDVFFLLLLQAIFMPYLVEL